MYGSTTFVERVTGALKLDANTFEDVEHDTNATGQAVAVVKLATILSGARGVTGGLPGIVGVVIWALVAGAWFCLRAIHVIHLRTHPLPWNIRVSHGPFLVVCGQHCGPAACAGGVNSARVGDRRSLRRRDWGRAEPHFFRLEHPVTHGDACADWWLAKRQVQ